jgi:hypothetical protein
VNKTHALILVIVPNIIKKNCTTAHCKTLLYRPLYEFAASAGKLGPQLEKKVTVFSCLDQSGKLAGPCRKLLGRKVLSKTRFTALNGGKIRI